MALTEVAETFEGLTFWRGNPGYEQAHRGRMWNRRVPMRYPDVVVQPHCDDDVVAAVRMARATWLEDCSAVRWA